MTQILRQSTEIKVRIGPFVDVTDGFTPETGVTLSGADEAEALKANGAATASISGATWAAITGADGWYDLTLTTSLTDTVGTLDVVVNDDSVCLPVFARFQVIEEAAFDAMYAASADPKADVNVGSIDANAITATAIASNAITSAKIAASAIGASQIASSAITSAKFASGAITATVIAADAIGASELAADAATEIGTAVWASATRQLTGTQTFNVTGNITGNLSGSVGSVTGAAGSVTGAVGSVTAGVTLANGAITDASLGGNMEIVFETDFATNYNTTRNAWATNVQDTVGTGNLTADVIAISGDTGAADNLELMYDGTGYAGGTTKLDVNIASTDDIDLSATQKASVNTEVDTALATTTYAEPGQGAPAATASLKDKIGYLYKSWRNKKDNDGTQTQLYADDGTTVDQKQSTTASGSTVTKGEWATGP